MVAARFSLGIADWASQNDGAKKAIIPRNRFINKSLPNSHKNNMFGLANLMCILAAEGWAAIPPAWRGEILLLKSYAAVSGGTVWGLSP